MNAGAIMAAILTAVGGVTYRVSRLPLSDQALFTILVALAAAMAVAVVVLLTVVIIDKDRPVQLEGAR